jgi:hypothetical protein
MPGKQNPLRSQRASGSETGAVCLAIIAKLISSWRRIRSNAGSRVAEPDYRSPQFDDDSFRPHGRTSRRELLAQHYRGFIWIRQVEKLWVSMADKRSHIATRHSQVRRSIDSSLRVVWNSCLSWNWWDSTSPQPTGRKVFGSALPVLPADTADRSAWH